MLLVLLAGLVVGWGLGLRFEAGDDGGGRGEVGEVSEGRPRAHL